MLANAYGAIKLLNGGVTAILSVFAAAILEAPILAVYWKVPFTRVLRWVVAANVCSAVLGVFPVFFARIGQGPGMDADPSWVYQHYWVRHLRDVVALFVISCAVELACYFVLVRRARAAVGKTRLLFGVIVANAFTYALLGLYVARPPTTTGDYEFRPDTSWISEDSERVWFVDPDSSKLCSVRLNGSDRKVEYDGKLGRFEKLWDIGSVYSLIPARREKIYLTEDRMWVAVTAHSTHRLDGPVNSQRWVRWETAPLIARALMRMGVNTSAPAEAAELKGIYYSGSAHDPWSQADERGDVRVKCATYWFDGTGTPLTVVDSRSGRTTSFRIPLGSNAYVCRDPVILPGERFVLFQCGDSIMVLDRAEMRVGRLVRGDSFVVEAAPFERVFFNSPPQTTMQTPSQP